VATIIRGARIGERPRKVSSRDKSLKDIEQSESTVDNAIDDASRLSSTSQKIVPTKVGASTVRENTNDRNSLLDSNPLAEALKFANTRATDLEKQLKDLQGEIDGLRIEARESGYSEGYAKGEQKGIEDYREKLNALDAIIEAISSKQKELLQGTEDAAVELAFAAVGKILFGHITSRDTVISIVKGLKKRLAYEPQQLIVHVSPNEYQALIEPTASECEFPAGLRLVADDRVKFGGCIVEADSGNLDARLEIQLQQLLELFANEKKRSNEVDLQPC
jgi:flagellar biosynthesis/type III secretory pathway protein FliH